jgi:hypothetical protein
MWLLVLQRLVFDAIVDVFYFPLWWYTGGVAHSIKWCYGFFLEGNRSLAPVLWLKNLLVPMFGQYDWQGRIISFFMRLVQFFFRSLALIFWLFFCLFLFFIWLILPIIFFGGLIIAI